MVQALTLGRAILTGAIWWDNDRTLFGTATDLASTYFVWQPLHKAAMIGHAAKWGASKSWPVAAGYLLGGAVGYGVSHAIWGESGAEDFADFWSNPTPNMGVMQSLQTIGTHYAQEAFSEIAPVVSKHPYFDRYQNPFVL